MFTDHEIKLEEHLNWLKCVEADDGRIIFVVLADDITSGVVSLNSIDKINSRAHWAFYLSKNLQGGFGAVLEFHFISFVFEHLSLSKLNCEVIETNEAVLSLHKKFGFVKENFVPEAIIRNDRKMGIYSLGLTKFDWEQNVDDIKCRYQRLINKFHVVIEYDKNRYPI